LASLAAGASGAGSKGGAAAVTAFGGGSGAGVLGKPDEVMNTAAPDETMHHEDHETIN
jgi:uncharacterized spore protein YtfJ